MTDYENGRAQNIEQNQRVLRALGLGPSSTLRSLRKGRSANKTVEQTRAQFGTPRVTTRGAAAAPQPAAPQPAAQPAAPKRNAKKKKPPQSRTEVDYGLGSETKAKIAAKHMYGDSNAAGRPLSKAMTEEFATHESTRNFLYWLGYAQTGDEGKQQALLSKAKEVFNTYQKTEKLNETRQILTGAWQKRNGVNITYSPSWERSWGLNARVCVAAFLAAHHVADPEANTGAMDDAPEPELGEEQPVRQTQRTPQRILWSQRAYELELWPAVAHARLYNPATVLPVYPKGKGGRKKGARATLQVANMQLGTRAPERFEVVYGGIKKNTVMTADEIRLAALLASLCGKGPPWLLGGDDADQLSSSVKMSANMKSTYQRLISENVDLDLTRDEQAIDGEQGMASARGSATADALLRAHKAYEAAKEAVVMAADIAKSRKPTVLTFVQSELNRDTLPHKRFPGFLTTSEGLSGGCVRCMRPFYEPRMLLVRDEYKTNLLGHAANEFKHFGTIDKTLSKFPVSKFAARRLYQKLRDLHAQDDELAALLLRDGVREGTREPPGGWKKVLADVPDDVFQTFRQLPAGFINENDHDQYFVAIRAANEDEDDESNKKNWVYFPYPHAMAEVGYKSAVQSFGPQQTNKWPGAGKKVQLMRYNSWQAQCNLCTECAKQIGPLLDTYAWRAKFARAEKGETTHLLKEAAKKSGDPVLQDIASFAQQARVSVDAVREAIERHENYVLNNDPTGLPAEYVRYMKSWVRRQRGARDGSMAPRVDATVLFRLGYISPQSYQTHVAKKRGGPPAGRVQVDVTTGSSLTGLVSSASDASAARQRHLKVLTEVRNLLNTKRLTDDPSPELAEALKALAAQHFRLSQQTEEQLQLSVESEFGMVRKLRKKHWADMELTAAEADQRRLQAREVQQSKFLLTLTQHRRATNNEMHNLHILETMSNSLRALMSDEDALKRIFRFGVLFKANGEDGPAWELWQPAKTGAATTGVGHYIQEKHFTRIDYVRAYEAYTGEPPSNEYINKFCYNDTPRTLKMTEKTHPYRHLVKGPMLLPDEYASDRFEDVVLSVDGQAGTEIGPIQRLFHFHMILDIKHLSKLQIDEVAFKEWFMDAWRGVSHEGKYRMTDVTGRDWILPQESLHMDTRLMAEDNYDKVLEAYVTKGSVGFKTAQLRAMAAAKGTATLHPGLAPSAQMTTVVPDATVVERANRAHADGQPDPGTADVLRASHPALATAPEASARLSAYLRAQPETPAADTESMQAQPADMTEQPEESAEAVAQRLLEPADDIHIDAQLRLDPAVEDQLELLDF